MSLPQLYAFTNTHTLSGGQAIPGDVYFSPETGLITPNYTRPRPELSEHVTRIDLKGEYVVAPGFIEVQINGLAGVHFTTIGKPAREDDQERLERVARQLVKHGVTGFFPTVPTVEKERYQQILPLLRPRMFTDRASILGAHVEGPYLQATKRGAHDPDLFQQPDLEPFQSLYGASNLRSIIKIVTLAPELPGSLEMIKLIRGSYPATTIALGHSTATLQQGQDALIAGARGITHLYNAMNPLHHRDPGLVGLIANNSSSDIPKESISSPSEHLLSPTVSVTDWLARHMASLDPTSANPSDSESASKAQPEVYFSVIPDLIHVHPAPLTMAHRTAPHRCILTTDSIELATLPDGTYPPNDQIKSEQLKKGDRATMVGSDTLIGSCITLDQGMRNMMEHCGCTLAEAVRCVTENVVGFLQSCDTLHGRGRLDIGCRADFVVLDRKGHVQQTWIGGVKVWDSAESTVT